MTFHEDINHRERQYLFDFYVDCESDPLRMGRIRYGLTSAFWA